MEIKDIFEKVENSKDWREFRVHELGEMLESALEEIRLLEDELSVELRKHLTINPRDANNALEKSATGDKMSPVQNG